MWRGATKRELDVEAEGRGAIDSAGNVGGDPVVQRRAGLKAGDNRVARLGARVHNDMPEALRVNDETSALV